MVAIVPRKQSAKRRPHVNIKDVVSGSHAFVQSILTSRQISLDQIIAMFFTLTKMIQHNNDEMRMICWNECHSSIHNDLAINLTCLTKRKASSSSSSSESRRSLSPSPSEPKTNCEYLPMTASKDNTSSSSSSTSTPSGNLSTSSMLSSPQSTSVSCSPNRTQETGDVPADQPPPSAPSPGLVLFNTEEQSDIIFNVGTDVDPNGEKWRFPAHSFIVGPASPTFETMIQFHKDSVGPSGNKPEIFIQCRPEIFHIMMSYIYKNERNITSVSNGLSLLLASNQFLLNDLSRACLTFLHQNVNSLNVLEVLSILRRPSNLHSSLPLSISPCPPNGPQRCLSSDDRNIPEECHINNNNYRNHFTLNCDNTLNDLVTKCYNILDASADKLLRSEDMENLEHNILIDILSRDTLSLSSELIVFDCLIRWACQQCKKQRLELTHYNKRQVLEKALYCSRYLVMNVDEFIKGPYVSDILTEEEKTCLLSRLNGDQSSILPVNLMGWKLDVKRKHLKPTGTVSPNRRCEKKNADSGNNSTLTPPSDGTVPTSGSPMIQRKKNSASKKLLNGLGDLMICVIQLLD